MDTQSDGCDRQSYDWEDNGKLLSYFCPALTYTTLTYIMMALHASNVLIQRNPSAYDPLFFLFKLQNVPIMSLISLSNAEYHYQFNKQILSHAFITHSPVKMKQE